MTAHVCTYLRATMRKAQSLKAARCIERIGVNRLADALLIRWPALVESFQRELDDARQIAREKGLKL